VRKQLTVHRRHPRGHGSDRPEPAIGEDTYLELSPEQVTTAEADYLYVSTHGPEGDTDRAKVLGGPLWQRVPAVKSGEVP